MPTGLSSRGVNSAAGQGSGELNGEVGHYVLDLRIVEMIPKVVLLCSPGQSVRFSPKYLTFRDRREQEETAKKRQ